MLIWRCWGPDDEHLLFQVIARLARIYTYVALHNCPRWRGVCTRRHPDKTGGGQHPTSAALSSGDLLSKTSDKNPTAGPPAKANPISDRSVPLPSQGEQGFWQKLKRMHLPRAPARCRSCSWVRFCIASGSARRRSCVSHVTKAHASSINRSNRV